MCGRYTLYETEDLEDRFEVAAPDGLPENYNVAPSQIMPVITQEASGRELVFMQWGLIPHWAKDPKIGNRLINARSESAFEKPVWRHIIRTQRCLIPANGFYEWKRTNASPKQPYYLHPRQDPLFAFAGVWESWKNPEGENWKTYSIMTTEPNQEVSSIHNRMPVILHKSDENLWLDPTNDRPEDIAPLLHPYDDNGIEMYAISNSVNAPQNNNSSLIIPLAA